MFLEAINAVLRIWESDPPYNIEGKYWTIKIEKQLMPEIGQGFLPGLGRCRSRIHRSS